MGVERQRDTPLARPDSVMHVHTYYSDLRSWHLTDPTTPLPSIFSLPFLLGLKTDLELIESSPHGLQSDGARFGHTDKFLQWSRVLAAHTNGAIMVRRHCLLGHVGPAIKVRPTVAMEMQHRKHVPNQRSSQPPPPSPQTID